MPGYYDDDPCDRPYGPGNPDYENDRIDDDADEAANHTEQLKREEENDHHEH